MAQIPVDGKNTYSRLSVLRAKAIIEKDGISVTWNDVISAMADVVEQHKEEFIESVKKKPGKQRNNGGEEMTEERKEEVEKAKEKVKKGEKVTSEDLEKANAPKTFKE